MTQRDYTIIFLLVLPFLITLPWGLVTYGKLQDQRELTEMTRDTLHQLRLELLEQRPPSPPVVSKPSVVAPAPVKPVAAAAVPVTTTPTTNRKTEPAPAPVPTTRVIADRVSTNPSNPNLNEQMESLTFTGLRAQNIVVGVSGEVALDGPIPNDYPRQLSVDFQLNEVADEYRGNRSLYLVVTDQSGETVTGRQPIRAKVPVRNSELELAVLATKNVELDASQRVRMVSQLDGALPTGSYRVQLFSDVAPLGMQDFTIE